MKQKGFSLVEGLLLVLILLIVGFGGYYVWSQNKVSEDENEQPTTVQQDEEEQDSNLNNKDTSLEQTPKTPNGWAIYENNDMGFSLFYPDKSDFIEDEQSSLFHVSFKKNDSNNPYIELLANGNYKIDVLLYGDGRSAADFLASGGYGKLQGEPETVDGVVRSISYVSSEEAMGPEYNVYWFQKDDKLLSISIYGDLSDNDKLLLINSVKLL